MRASVVKPSRTSTRLPVVLPQIRDRLLYTALSFLHSVDMIFLSSPASYHRPSHFVPAYASLTWPLMFLLSAFPPVVALTSFANPRWDATSPHSVGPEMPPYRSHGARRDRKPCGGPYGEPSGSLYLPFLVPSEDIMPNSAGDGVPAGGPYTRPVWVRLPSAASHRILPSLRGARLLRGGRGGVRSARATPHDVVRVGFSP